METGLSSATVLITGASGGIGRALARAFGAEGARLVLVAGRRLAELEALVAREPWRDDALCLSADISNRAAIESCFRRAEDRFGPVDVCVANAGLWPREALTLHEVSPERIERTIATNLLGTVWTARAFMAGLARRGGAGSESPSLILIGSTAGRFGEAGHADYAAAKAALRGLALSLKNEIVRVVPGGRVNVVEPGWTVTEMARPEIEAPGTIARALATMPLRRLARADEIARSVLFLASPLLARHVTGEVLAVAGGMEGRLLWSREEIDEDDVRTKARRR